jgi:hypothetical protein
MEGFSRPRYTKRIAGAACQAPPHRPRGAAAVHTVGSLILWPCSLVPPGLCYPKLPPLRPTNQPLRLPSRRSSDIHDLCQVTPSGLHGPAGSPLCRTTSPRPAMLEIHTHGLCSTGPCTSVLHKHALISTLLPMPLRPAQACKISTGTIPLKSVKPAIHKHAGSPLCLPRPFRHARPTLQRPVSSLGKASACKHMGTHPPATCHRRTSNLPKRHTHTSLDARGVTTQQLGLQFYCSRTSEFFFPFFKGFAAWFAV